MRGTMDGKSTVELPTVTVVQQVNFTLIYIILIRPILILYRYDTGICYVWQISL